MEAGGIWRYPYRSILRPGHIIAIRRETRYQLSYRDGFYPADRIIYTNQAVYLLGRPAWGVTQLRYRPPRILVAIRRRKDLPIKKLCDDSAEPGVIFN